MHLAEGGYRAAIRWLEQIAPGDPRYREAAFLLGVARYQTGDYRGAAELFSALAETAPSACVWNNLGLALHRLGDPAALETVEHAAAAEPTDPDYQFNAGYLLWRRGDLAAARERFQAAVTLDPNDAAARQLLERSIEQQGPRRGDLSSENLERLKEAPAGGPRSGGSRRRAEIRSASP
jgi:tetratricopeptide (TPR) repeat protein